MTPSGIAFIIAFLTVITILALLLGRYMASVFEGWRTFLTPVCAPLERLIYRVCSINAQAEMSGREYMQALTIFTVINLLFLFLVQILQRLLPLNPQVLPAVRWDTALNTAVSFVTNTNWQAYSGEAVMSYLSQMLGLAVQNFVSAAVGLAAALAMVRGFVRKECASLGNFWVDLVRSVLYVLLPLSLILALGLVAGGVVQTLHPYVRVQTLDTGSQAIALGPAASQIAIKQLGSNGGGFFNANSSHPFENPTPLTDILENLAILLLPIALVFAFGRMVGNRQQGWAIYGAMLILFLLGLAVVLAAETSGNPWLARLGVARGLNLEGKEVRFGLMPSALWGQSTTATSNGSVNAMHDSMMPLSGLVYMFNMGIGEVIFGGVGVGLMSMLFYALMTMFIAGLMVGRTPEFLGKKLGPREMVMAVIGLLLPPMVLLIGAAVAVMTRSGLAGLTNPAAHGLSEILYAYSSAVGNNGSAFAGLNANTPFYNLTLSVAILVGRFATLLPGLAIADALARKKTVPAGVATFPTTSLLFVLMLVSVVIIVGALTYFPVFALGPLLEHLRLLAGQGF